MPFKPSGVASNQVALVTISTGTKETCSVCVCTGLLEWKWACSYWHLVPMHLPPGRPQCLLTMARVFPVSHQVFPKETHSKYLPSPLGSLKENEILVHTVVPCNLRFLMWSLSNVKDLGGNIFTMLVIILHNTWILNAVTFQCKWWLFLFMSSIWFCSCNSHSILWGGIIRGFVQTRFSVCGYFGKMKGGSVVRLEEFDQEGLISFFFSE